PWTDPSVKQALATLAEIFGRPDWLAGGAEGALNTTYEQSVSQVFGSPSRAAMVYEGNFVTNRLSEFVKGNVADQAAFFDFPTIGGRKPLIIGGDVAVLFTNNQAGKELIRFLAKPEAANMWARAGAFLSPNNNVDLKAYSGDLTRASARQLTQAGTLRFDLSDLQPSAFGATKVQGMWKLLQDFLRNPHDVDNTTKEL